MYPFQDKLHGIENYYRKGGLREAIVGQMFIVRGLAALSEVKNWRTKR